MFSVSLWETLAQLFIYLFIYLPTYLPTIMVCAFRHLMDQFSSHQKRERQ